MRQVFTFDVEAPASTAQTAPIEVATPLPPGPPVSVKIIIPDGHSGLTGIALAVAHTPIIPYTEKATPTSPFSFIEGNDEVVPYDLDGYPDSGQWSAFVFNTDVNPHKWQIRYVVGEVVSPTPPPGGAMSALALTPGGEVEGGSTEPVGGLTAPPPPPSEEPTTAAPEVKPEEGAGVPAPEGEEPGAPPTPAPPSEGDESEGEPPAPGPSSPTAAKPKVHPTTRPAKSRFALRTTHEELPAGGWLPHGARFELQRDDQGVDFITNWRGPITAPGDGRVVAILHDRPFPDGFGPHYAVVHITTGRWAGEDYYIGHGTAAVRAGEHFTQGTVLAHADQGHREGGGWIELGPAPGGVPGPMGGGARIRHLFTPLTITHTRRVEIRSKGVAPPKPKESHHALRSPPPPRGQEPPGARAPHRPPGVRPGVHPGRVPDRAVVPSVHRPSEPPRAAPPPPRAVRPPSPPPRPRPPAPRPVRRR